jgi:hypothetical protein
MAMSSNESSKREKKVQAALKEFREAWLSGTPYDLEDFLKKHADCGPQLRDSFGLTFNNGTVDGSNSPVPHNTRKTI